MKQLKFKGDGISTMLPAASTDILADVRAKVKAVFAAGSPGANVKLAFGDIILLGAYTAAAASSDGPSPNTLGSYGVTNKATIAVEVTRPLTNISVKQRGQDAIALNVEASNTIDDVKEEIQEAKGIAPNRQQLKFKNATLAYGTQTLSVAGVKHNDVLQLFNIKGKGKGKG